MLAEEPTGTVSAEAMEFSDAGNDFAEGRDGPDCTLPDSNEDA